MQFRCEVPILWNDKPTEIIMETKTVVNEGLPVENNTYVSIVEGSLETKVPTIWTDEKQHSQEEAEPGRNWDV